MKRMHSIETITVRAAVIANDETGRHLRTIFVAVVLITLVEAKDACSDR